MVSEGANVTQAALDDFGALNDGLYHLVYFTFDGVTYKMYLDNVKETNEASTIRNVDNATSLWIGRDVSTGRRCNSNMAYQPYELHNHQWLGIHDYNYHTGDLQHQMQLLLDTAQCWGRVVFQLVSSCGLVPG